MCSRSFLGFSVVLVGACHAAVGDDGAPPGTLSNAGASWQVGAGAPSAAGSANGGWSGSAPSGGVGGVNGGSGSGGDCEGDRCAGAAAQGAGGGALACRGPSCPLPCGVHRFRYDPKGRKLDSVRVSGSFNAWQAEDLTGLDYSSSDGAWSGAFDLGPGTFSYKFVLNGSEWVTDPANPDLDELSQNSALKITCPVTCIGSSTGFDWHDQVLYSVLIDRFADSDGKGSSPGEGGTADDPRFGYGGGDLQGIRQHLDYIQGLGATALWLSPPVLNGLGGYHGYYPAPPNLQFDAQGNASPSPEVDPHFGSAQDMHALLDAAHGAQSGGLRVILDYVMKHVHQSSPLTGAHPEFFIGSGQGFRLCDNGTADPSDDLWDDPVWRTKCAFDSWLYPFDFDASSDALGWSLNDAAWWAKTFDFDGFRLDAITHVSTRWPTALRARINQQFASRTVPLYVVGETFDYGQAAIRRLVDPRRRLDGQFDFPLRARLTDALLVEKLPLDQLASWVSTNDHYYGVESIMSTFLGNHDLPRSIHYANGQIDAATTGSGPSNNAPGQFTQPTDAIPYQRMALAFAVLLTSPGIPVLYYGDEIGLAGGGDPENRRMMPWRDGALLPPQKALRESVRQLLSVRAKYRVLSRGTRSTLSADHDTWLYRMSACSAWKNVLVAINRGASARSFDLPAGTERDVLSGETVSSTLTVPAHSFRLLEEAAQ